MPKIDLVSYILNLNLPMDYKDTELSKLIPIPFKSPSQLDAVLLASLLFLVLSCVQ